MWWVDGWEVHAYLRLRKVSFAVSIYTKDTSESRHRQRLREELTLLWRPSMHECTIDGRRHMEPRQAPRPVSIRRMVAIY